MKQMSDRSGEKLNPPFADGRADKTQGCESSRDEMLAEVVNRATCGLTRVKLKLPVVKVASSITITLLCAMLCWGSIHTSTPMCCRKVAEE
jgi:hypothetical protein